VPKLTSPVSPLKAHPLRSSAMAEQLTTLGEFIGAQRRTAELSLRQLAEQAGVSNPYLSQIERGLRKPSAEVLQHLARALRISAETLYVRAGILDPAEHSGTTVEAAIRADTKINERQKQVLTDIYASFLSQHGATPRSEPPVQQPMTKRPAAKKAAAKKAPGKKAPACKAAAKQTPQPASQPTRRLS